MRAFARIDEEGVLDELIVLRRSAPLGFTDMTAKFGTDGARHARHAILTALIDIVRDGRLREFHHVQ